MTSLKEFVVNWAARAESALKKGYRLSPPGEIFDYLDLLGRGWGWDRLAPCSGSNEWPAYKKYLKEYYRRNRAESISQAWQNEKDDGAAVNGNTDWNALTPRSSLHEQEDYADGNGIRDGGILVPLVSLCIKMEIQFISECERQGKADQTADHIMVSEEIQGRALSLKDMEGEFPVAAAALMFITKKAELMCEWMRHGAYNPDSKVTEVRRYALDLMMYTGSDSDCAAAVLVGISKETKMICECLRQGTQVETLPWSKAIMENGWDILLLLHDECISSGNGNGTAATKAGNTTQTNYKKPDCDKDSKDIGNLVLEKYSEIGSDSLIDIRELAVEWASSVQAYLNMDSMLLPPGGIFDHLDLLEKGWGWNRLLPYIGSHDWSSYKNYLKQYYCHNHTKLVAQACLNEKVASAAGIGNIDGNGLTAPCLNGSRYVTHWRKEQEACTAGNGAGVGTGLAPLVRMCLNMEKKFIYESQRQGVGGDASGPIILSGEIQKCALSLMNLEGEFPVAAAALMCIMKNAELMCELLRLGTVNPESMVNVRQYALNLMMYRGSEYACAAAIMLGIAKETKKICKCLRQGESITRVHWSKIIMENGWDVLEMLHDEFLCAGNGDGTAATEAGNSPRINTVGELNHKKPDDEKNSEERQCEVYETEPEDRSRQAVSGIVDQDEQMRKIRRSKSVKFLRRINQRKAAD